MNKRIALVLVAVLTLFVGAGCSTAEKEKVEVGQDTIILDVRTPAEFAEGHLEGAELLDLNSGQFAATLPSLDPEARYIVYCRSGNRSAHAVALMEDAGFIDVTDLGALQRAADATGVAVVK